MNLHPARILCAILLMISASSVLYISDSVAREGEGWSSPLLSVDSPEALLRKSPESLAREVIKQGDIAFLGIAGFTVSVPGVEEEERCAVKRSKTYIVPGTSDVLTTRQSVVQEKAAKIATAYNRIIRDHLAQSGSLRTFFECVK